MTKKTPLWISIPLLFWTACSSQPEAPAVDSEAQARLAAAEKDRLETHERLELHRSQLRELVSEFFQRHPAEQLSPEMLSVMEEMGISPQDPETFSDANPGEFLSLATVYAFLESYPYDSLPPELADKFARMGIVPGQPSTYREADLLEFSRATGGFTWDSHVRQVEVQKTANRRQEQVVQLEQDRQRLNTELGREQLKSTRLQQQVGVLEGQAQGLQQRVGQLRDSLQTERAEHRLTAAEKQQLEGRLDSLQLQAKRASAEAEDRIARLQEEKWRIEEALRRGEHYRQALAAAQRVVESYRQMTQQIEQQSLSDDELDSRWTAFRMQVKHATALARKTRKKGDTEAAREVGATLEELLRRLPKKFWMSVEAPSGDVYRVSLDPQVEPLIEEIEAWRSL